MAPMKSKTGGAALILCAAAPLAIAALLVWLFSLQSTLGLFEWNPSWRRIFLLIGAAGLLPLLLGLATLPRMPERRRTLGSVLRVSALAVSALALLLACGLFAYLWSTSHSIASAPPALRLVDPSKGLSGSGGILRISLSSDPHWGSPTSDRASRNAILSSLAAASPRRDALFILGDNVETGMMDSSWRDEAADLLALAPELPVRPLLGNHDGLIDGQYHFKAYFFPPALHSDSGSPYYYSMNAGPATIIVLNLLWGAESFEPAQAAWLEKTLSALPEGRQAIVLSHAFMYGSGYDDPDGDMPWYDNAGNIKRVVPILERHHVALVVSGHNHYMELLRKNGVTYAVVGAMGGVPDPIPTHHSPASIWFRQGSFGWLDLDIGAAGIALSFRGADGASLREDFIAAAR
jgi:UDP-2,3-diacylglucosamine pyrophosphatase LpxH